MKAPSFELTLSLPHDARFVSAVGGLVVHAAQYAGCAPARAETFAREVEALVRCHLADPAAPPLVPIVVRLAAGPLEIVVNGRTMTLEI